MAILIHIVDKEIQELGDLFLILDGVIVVQNQKEILGDSIIDLLDHAGDHVIQTGANISLAPQKGPRALAKSRKAPGDGPDQVFQEHMEVAVKGIESIPADRQAGVVGEIDQERGLAKACRRRNDQQLAVQVSVDKVHEPAPRQQGRDPARDADLGHDQRPGIRSRTRRPLHPVLHHGSALPLGKANITLITFKQPTFHFTIFPARSVSY